MDCKKQLFFMYIIVAVFLRPEGALSLPFNDDMVDSQLRTGTIMRPKAKGSVPKGSLSYRVESKEEAEKLKNIRKDSPLTVKRGKLLYQSNCYPCHGNIEAEPYTPGPVALKGLMPPDITDKYYHEKSDGYFYGTIHFGGLALMPPLGWKLSPEEHWDIVNYVRSVQKTKGK